MKRVSIEDLNTAAEWLANNEGDEAESGACKRVAAMLDQMVADRHLKSAARKRGVSLGKLKEVLKRGDK